MPDYKIEEDEIDYLIDEEERPAYNVDVSPSAELDSIEDLENFIFSQSEETQNAIEQIFKCLLRPINKILKN